MSALIRSRDHTAMLACVASPTAWVFPRVTVSKMKNIDDPSLLDEAFKIFDADGSGTITKTELKSTLNDIMSGTGESLPDGEIDELIKEFDKDGDGKWRYSSLRACSRHPSTCSLTPSLRSLPRLVFTGDISISEFKAAMSED